MLCPLLEEVWINDMVMEKMSFFFVEYEKNRVGNLVDYMRAFFGEVWWIANKTHNFYSGLGFDTQDHYCSASAFVTFAEESMDNYRHIANKRLGEEWESRQEPGRRLVP